MSQSVDKYLASLDTDELFDLHRVLYEMQQTEGWARYVELLEVHREWAVKRMTQPVTGDPSAAHYASIGGMIRGMEHAEEMPQAVEKRAAQVRAALAARNGD